jgi:hypothetical protein
MHYIQGNNRHQTYFASLENQVSADNRVRLMDAFIDKGDLQKIGFSNTVHKSEGRQPYAPAVILKLYLYGYLNKIRSSRPAQSGRKGMPALTERYIRAGSRNIELQWLIQSLQPNYQVLPTLENYMPMPFKICLNCIYRGSLKPRPRHRMPTKAKKCFFSMLELELLWEYLNCRVFA